MDPEQGSSFEQQSIEQERASRLRVLDVLGRQRHWIALVYFAVALSFTFSLAFDFSFAFAGVDLLVWLLTGYTTGEDVTIEIDHDLFVVWSIVVVAFFVLQAAFIWGGGRVRISTDRIRGYRKIVTLLIFSLLMSCLSISAVIVFLEFGDRTGGEGSVRSQAKERKEYIDLESDDEEEDVEEEVALGFWLFDDEGNLSDTALKVLVISWLLWLLIGLVYVRDCDHVTFLGKLTRLLIAGSWIEFVVALSVDVAIRPRSQDCPCATGSWMGLVVCVPILVWSIGPGIFLIYLRERRLADQFPDRPRRVLARKSQRVKNGEPKN